MELTLFLFIICLIIFFIYFSLKINKVKAQTFQKKYNGFYIKWNYPISRSLNGIELQQIINSKNDILPSQIIGRCVRQNIFGRLISESDFIEYNVKIIESKNGLRLYKISSANNENTDGILFQVID